MKRANSSIMVKVIAFGKPSEDETLFKRAFPEAQKQNLPPTAWKLHVKVYQLRTNCNPRTPSTSSPMAKSQDCPILAKVTGNT